MSWCGDSSQSLRSHVALVEQVYGQLVSSLKDKVRRLEDELGGVKEHIVDLQDTVHNLHGEVGCMQTGNEMQNSTDNKPSTQADAARNALLQIRDFLNKHESFCGSSPAEVGGATLTQTERPSMDSLFSFSHEESSETPAEPPPFMNAEFMKKLSSVLLRPPPHVAPDKPLRPLVPSQASRSVPSRGRSPTSTSVPHRSSGGPPNLYLPVPSPVPSPPPPPPPPTRFPPIRPNAHRSHKTKLPTLGRHAPSSPAASVSTSVLRNFKRYCLVTQGAGTGGLSFFENETQIRLKTGSRDQMYQFDRVFKTESVARAVPEALRKDISKVAGGKEVCVIMFGHSYTGKTRLLLGAQHKHGNTGLLGKTAKKIIRRCRSLENVAIKVSACELFSGETRDLLREGNKASSTTNWDTIPTTWIDIVRMDDVRSLSRIIWKRRRMRVDCLPPSSASHLLVTLAVVRAGSTVGRILLVDLAGFRTHATMTRSEADRYINFSQKDLLYALSGLKYDKGSVLVQLIEDFLKEIKAGVHVFCCLGRWEGQQDANYLALHYLGN